MRIKNRQTGFTIVELLIVIVIIGILATLSFVAYRGISQRARVAGLQSDLVNASKQLKLYQVTNMAYPTALDCTATPAANSTCLKASPSTTYQYTVDNTVNQQTFCLTATNSGIDYTLTHDTAPVAGVCPGQLAAGIPATVADNFNRTAGTLGVTSTGTLPWTALSGTWSTNGTMASTTALNSSNPLATVNFGSANVDASVGVSSGGGDALYIRVTDATNWIRARVRSWTTIVSTYHPQGYTAGGYYYGTGWVNTFSSWVQNSVDSFSEYALLQNGIYQQWQVVGGADSYSAGLKTNNKYAQSVAYQGTYWVDTSYWSNDSTPHYTVILDKSVAGVITTLGTSAELAAPTSLRLRAVGTAIDAFTNGGATAVTTATEASFTTIGKHGIGRGLSDNNGQGLDNFTITSL